jgi:hypothetical protein
MQADGERTGPRNAPIGRLRRHAHPEGIERGRIDGICEH